jgi:putative ABC transport system permease protein
MKLLLILATSHLRRNSLRTRLLASGIALACMLSIVLAAFEHGVVLDLVEGSTALVGGQISVVGINKPAREKVFHLAGDLTELKKVIEASVTDLERVVVRHRTPTRLIARGESIVVANTLGIDVKEDPELLRILSPAKQSAYKRGGKEVVLGDLSRLGEPGSIALFARQAKNLRVDVGDTITLRAPTLRNVENAVDVNVVAVLQDMGLITSWNALADKDTISTLLGVPRDSAGLLGVRLRNVESTEQSLAEIRSGMTKANIPSLPAMVMFEFSKRTVLEAQPWVGQKYIVASWIDELFLTNWVLDVLHYLRLGLLFVVCAVIGTGVANVSLMTTRERIPQIGVLRALGMRRGKVLLSLALEMMLLAVGTGLVGIAAGALLSQGLDAMEIVTTSKMLVNNTMSDTLRFALDWRAIVSLMSALTAVSLIGAVVGGIRSLSVEPTVAIRHVD